MRVFLLTLALALSAGLALAGKTAGSSGEQTIRATLVKRAEIGFAPGAAGIPAVVRPQLERLAAELKRTVAREQATVLVEAYARESASRIVALQRVVDVRGALVDRGVPAERIDVRVSRADGRGRMIPNVVVIWYRRPPPKSYRLTPAPAAAPTP